MSKQKPRVLLVDDQEALVQLMQRVLAARGYEVEVDTRAEQAWRRVQTDPQRYDVVVTDLSFPGMSGEELIDALVQLNPEVRIVVMTGYPFSVSKLPMAVRRQVAYLQKPFMPGMLSDAIAALLADRSAPS